MVKWWSRVAAAVTGATLALVIPVHAWAASNGVAEVAVEAARRGRRGGFAVFGLLCCVAVIAVVMLAIVLFSRKRKRR